MSALKPKFIPQAAPGLRFNQFGREIERAVRDCVQDGTFILGPQTRLFEGELADFLGADHVVSCNSGTDALFLCLKALGIGEGDEVIVPSFTAAGSAMAIIRTGATPRFVDISPESRCVDARHVEAAITSRVRAAVVVHLHGNSASIDEIMAVAAKRSIVVVEDCAQSIGACHRGRSVGTFGHAAAFSFYPTKNLGCIGDGGAVATNDHDLAREIASMRHYGWSKERLCVREGINSRLDEIQAAILRVLLPHLPAANAARRDAARRYDKALAGLDLKPLVATEGSVYHQYVIEVEDRDRLMNQLANHQIGTDIHYEMGLHRHPYFQGRVPQSDVLLCTEKLSTCALSLPIQPELMTEQDRIINTLGEILAS